MTEMIENIKFKNARKVTSRTGTKYLFTLTGKEIHEMLEGGFIKYNFDTQRGYTEKKGKDGEIIKEPILNKARVNKIVDAMVKESFYEETIIFNTSTPAKDLKITAKTDNLVNIELIGSVDILDGYHRGNALLEYARLCIGLLGDLDLKRLERLVFPIELTLLPVGPAQTKFYQLSLGGRINATRTQYFNREDAANLIIKQLMLPGKALCGRVDVSKNTISKNEEVLVTTFSTLSQALKEYGKVELMSKSDIEIYIEHLNIFFNDWFEINSAFFEKRKENSKNDFSFDNIAFYGYVALATKVFDDNKEDIKKQEYEYISDVMDILKEIPLKKNDNLWQNMVIVKENKDGDLVLSIPNTQTNKRKFAQGLLTNYAILKGEE